MVRKPFFIESKSLLIIDKPGFLIRQPEVFWDNKNMLIVIIGLRRRGRF